MKSYLIIKDKVVKNIVEWDGTSSFDYGESSGYSLVDNSELNGVIGDYYINGKIYHKPGDGYDYYFDNSNLEWIMTNESISQKKVDDISNGEKIKENYLSVASAKIGPLQDAVDLDMATDEEKEQLISWKKYRVLVNRVDTSTAPNITWPDQPTS